MEHGSFCKAPMVLRALDSARTTKGNTSSKDFYHGRDHFN